MPEAGMGVCVYLFTELGEVQVWQKQFANAAVCVCMCMNPSGNDSETIGPVGVMQ